jgi:isocitrate lyase
VLSGCTAQPLVQSRSAPALHQAAQYHTHRTQDLVWFETGEPNLEEARQFVEAMHAKYPGA